MGKLQRAKEALANAKLLREQGYAIKDSAIAVLQGEVWIAEGKKQIWWCSQCPDYKLVLFVRAVGTSCNNGHEARLLWESPKENTESLVALALDQPKSHQNQDSPKSNPPLQDNHDRLLLPVLHLASFQKRTDD